MAFAERREEKKRKDRKKQVVQAKLECDELPQDPLQVVVSPRTREEVEGRKGSRSKRLSGKPLAMMRQQQLTSSELEESAVADVAVAGRWLWRAQLLMTGVSK